MTLQQLQEIIQGDCLEEMKKMPDNSFDCVVTDPPYGTTNNKWDVSFDLDIWWEEIHRIVDGAVVLTASQPFTSKMVVSNLGNFRHEWIWQKNAGSNFANTVREPMKEHESVLVFSEGTWTYNKQMQPRAESGKARVKTPVKFETGSDNYRQFERVETKKMPELRVPSSVQKFNRQRGVHPTQKPVDLLVYLIRTYTNKGDTILDPFMGSGTTLVAAKQLGREATGIEISEEYCEIARKRLSETQIPIL